jgi:hypothetical protein
MFARASMRGWQAGTGATSNTLLPRKEKLTLDGKKALKALLFGEQAAQHCLTPEGELRSIDRLFAQAPAPRGHHVVVASCAAMIARRASARNAHSYEKFAEMIDRHWERYRSALSRGATTRSG